MPKAKTKKRSKIVKKIENDAVKLIMKKSKLGRQLTDFNDFLITMIGYLKKFHKDIFTNIAREDLTPEQKKESYLAISKAAGYYLRTHISMRLTKNNVKITKKTRSHYKNTLTRAFQNFRSPQEVPIELLDRIGDKRDLGYSNFLNSVFNINTREYTIKWRLNHLENKTPATIQCFEVLKLFHDERNYRETKGAYKERIKWEEANGQRKDNWFSETGLPDNYQRIFPLGKCYICNSSLMNDPDFKLECEHIFPVFSALSHIWFYQGSDLNFLSNKENKKLFQILLLEYEWSHRCCNQKKKDLPFIIFQNGKCQFNNNMAYEILKKIVNSSLYKLDLTCEVKKIGERIERDKRNIDDTTGLPYKKIIRRISRRVQPLIEIINTTIDRNFSSIPPPQMPAKVKKDSEKILALLDSGKDSEMVDYIKQNNVLEASRSWNKEKKDWKTNWSNVIFSKFTRLNLYIAWTKLRALAMLDDRKFQNFIKNIPVRKRAAEVTGTMIGGELGENINYDSDFEDDMFVSMVLTFGIPSLNIEPYMIGFTNDSEMLVKGYGIPNTFLNISTPINKNRFNSYILSLKPLMDIIETATEEKKQKILYEVENKPFIPMPSGNFETPHSNITSDFNTMSENKYSNYNIQSSPEDYLKKTFDKMSYNSFTPSTISRSPHTTQRIPFGRVHGGKKKKKRTKKKKRKHKKKTRKKKA